MAARQKMTVDKGRKHMIKHIYLIKLKNRTDAPAVAERLRTLKREIPEIASLEIGIDFRGAENSYDLVECVSFRTEEDFRRFGENAYHEEIRRYLKTVQLATAKVDFSSVEPERERIS